MEKLNGYEWMDNDPDSETLITESAAGREIYLSENAGKYQIDNSGDSHNLFKSPLLAGFKRYHNNLQSALESVQMILNYDQSKKGAK